VNRYSAAPERLRNRPAAARAFLLRRRLASAGDIAALHEYARRLKEEGREGLCDRWECDPEKSLRVRARIGDRRVLPLVKAFLKARIMNERGDLEGTLTDTPQGGILTAPTQ
jgi:hypothetical protein